MGLGLLVQFHRLVLTITVTIWFSSEGLVMGEEAVITVLAKTIKVILTGDILEVFPSVAVATDPAVVAVGVSTFHVVLLVGLQLTVL